MELGEKILQARQALGLSQRQLCGDTITRNMLSQIEHGTARPSMDTLRILAQRLGKPLRYFLEEESEVTANGTVMEQIRSAWGREEYELARELLSGYQKPDPIFDWAYELYVAMIRLALAEQALETGKLPYARSLLDSLDVLPEGFPELSRKKAWLEARLTGNCSGLPSLDEELFLRAKDAFGRGQYDRCGHLMDAMERGALYLHSFATKRGRLPNTVGNYRS